MKRNARLPGVVVACFFVPRKNRYLRRMEKGKSYLETSGKGKERKLLSPNYWKKE